MLKPLVRPVLTRASRSRRCACASGVLLAALAAAPALGQGWGATPAHGQNGLRYESGTCSTVWDPDGAGPAPAMLVVATELGGVEAWTGSAFVPFGGQPVGTVRSLAVFGGQLYAGGTFSKLGADVVNNVARWDGSHWQPLGSGMTGAGNPGNPTGSVNSMVVVNGLLCIGGTFVPASTGVWTSFATWDGVTLTAGLATQAPISQFYASGTQLYAATTATVPGVWRYDTTVWTRLGTLADRDILTLTSYHGDLVCGGAFSQFFTGVPIAGVARWSGTQWVPMGAGVSGGGYTVTALSEFGGQLIAGGSFTTMDGWTVDNIAAWDGARWTNLAGGLQPALFGSSTCVKSLALFGGELVATGHIRTSGTQPDSGIARWNGSAWRPFVAGINGRVRTLLSTGTAVYVGGDFEFDWRGSTVHHGFGSDGITTVSPLGTPPGVEGTDGSISAFVFHQFSKLLPADLIVGGTFTQGGGLAAPDVAEYTSLGAWGPLGNGFDGSVLAVANLGRTLYAAGLFTASGATPLSHLALYGTGGWTDPGAGAFGPLYALLPYNGALAIGGVPGGDGVSSWDGVTLTNLGATDGPVFALAAFNSDLVAAGAFTSIAGVPAAGVARRSSVTGAWSAMDAGFSQGVPHALAVYNAQLYAGGTFLSSGNLPTGCIARWTGSSWVGVLGGLDGPVFALAALGQYLEVGGDFQQSSSGVVSPWWIEYDDGFVDVERVAPAAALALGASHPNPASGASHVEFSLATAGRARLVLLDVAGRVVRTLSDGAFAAGSHAVTWDGVGADGRPCPAGIYFYRLEAAGRALTRRVALVR